MKKQILMLLGVATLTYASVNLTFVETAATLTRPTNWTYEYKQSGGSPDWIMQQNGGGFTLNPGYTRTTDGSFFNYTTTRNNSSDSFLPSGLSITMTFDRSNTNWVASGTGLFYPFGGGQIGSDNSVGTAAKIRLRFNNQTNKNYFLFIDASSNASAITINQEINGLTYGYQQLLQTILTNAFTTFPIYAYTDNTFVVVNSNARYFDAWYLLDLGISAAYNEGYNVGETDGYNSGLSDGYDIGYDQGQIVGYEDGYEIGYDEGTEYGISATPIQNIFTAIFSGIANIFNISIFGNITLGTIILAPIAVALLWFILGIISGVGGKK